LNGAKKVFLKEIRDLLRDKRIRSSAFVGPFSTVILILCLFGFLMGVISKPSNEKIDFVKRAASGSLVAEFKKAGINVTIVNSIEAGEKRIKDGTSRLVIDPGENFDGARASGKSVSLGEYFDPNQEASGVARTHVQMIISAMNDLAVKQALTSVGLSPEASQPLKLQEHEVSQGTGGANQMLIGILPYIIILWAFYGGLGAVSDMVAGEKEKNTLETTLITPISRRDIAIGKLSALACLCAASSLSSVVALIVVWAAHLNLTKPLFEKGLGITPIGLLQVIVVLIPSVFLFSSVLMAVSTWARNTRECQTKLTMISMVFLMPAMFSQFIGYTDFARASWIAAIPVLNSSMSVRQAISGEFHPAFLAITIGVNLVLGLIAITYTIALFKREDVLLRI
jgi:sodium transport system permease protein